MKSTATRPICRWKPIDYTKSEEETTLRLGMDLKAFPGHVEKRITLVPGQTVVYQKHIITGVNAPTSLGHHSILKFPDKPGSGRLSTSKRMLGQVFVEPTEKPEDRGYSILKPGAVFDDLAAVPTITGETTDLGRYPARRGFEDIAILVADPTLPVAWTAVAFPDEGYVWFAFRDPQGAGLDLALDLERRAALSALERPAHQRHGRGRYHRLLPLRRGPIGKEQRPQPSKASRPALRPPPSVPCTSTTSRASAAIPKTFDRVKDIVVESNQITLVSDRGATVSTPVNTEFLKSAE